jgi:hypothetical protein
VPGGGLAEAAELVFGRPFLTVHCRSGMSRFVDVFVRSLEPSFDPVVAHARRGRWALQQVLSTQGVAGAGRLKGEALEQAAREVARGLGVPAAVQAFVATVLRRPRIAAAVAATICAGGLGTSQLTAEQQAETHLVWFVQNFLRDALGAGIAGVERHQVVLEVRARSLPEGAIPSQRKLAERMPVYASRVLRDRDAADNPWVDRFGLDAMAHRSWHAGPIDAAWMAESTARSGVLHVVVAPAWTTHLTVGDRFEAAP